jgi:ABC-type nitrate/sulfonate/bicarbonate transport system substrate-binding protein
MATPIVIAAPRPAPFFTPLFVAIDKGFLAEQGLEGTMRYQMLVEDMLRGEVDFVSGGPGYKAFLEGTPVRQIAGLSSRESSHVLIVRPEIESPEQIECVLIPAGSGSRSSDRFVKELTNILTPHGVDLPQSGIETQGVEGSHKEQWDMLQHGIADGATLGAPWSIHAVKAGYRNWGHETDYRPSASGSGVFVTPDTIARRPDVVQAFLHAYVKSMRYCLENVDGAVETIMQYSREWGVDSVEIARAAYDDVAPYWRLDVDAAVLGQAMQAQSAQLG